MRYHLVKYRFVIHNREIDYFAGQMYMFQHVSEFSEEQRRVLVNIEQHYDVWMDAVRTLQEMPYGLRWTDRSGREYLYQSLDRHGNAKSLGVRSLETEAMFDNYHAAKDSAETRRSDSLKTLVETCGVYRSLRLPQIATEAAKILREADKRRMLGKELLVVGTNAMAAYNIEAGGHIRSAPHETDDFDMTWSAVTKDPTSLGLMPMLKAVDSTYTTNTEKTFQARNSKAFEVEILAAPSTVSTFGRNDKPFPIPLPEQEWLLNGRQISHVVIGRDGSPARLVVPDPRYFALQKAWLSKQEKRNPLKRPKDAAQAQALLGAIAEAMPQFPMNDEFVNSLPEELRTEYDQWMSSVPVARPNTPNWW